jgi:two-component system, sensor histidine kinase and response regulator
VKMMGGKIWVESEEGRGSTFHFTAQLTASEDASAGVYAEAMSLRGVRALIVEDNATNRRILVEWLRRWEMKAVAAQDAGEAVEMLRQAASQNAPFELLVTDAQMPVMDGFALARQIRQDTELHQPGIVMLTSSGQRGDAARCLDAGIAACLTKPARHSELRGAIQRALGQTSHDPTTPSDRLITRHSHWDQTVLPPLKLLLAEDNMVNQQLARKLLEKRGHTVTIANNGLEAIALLSRQTFDLILMDVQMPEMDGFEATAAIRKKEATTGGHLPIIAMTAHAMKGDEERCLIAGMDAYVTKPIQVPQLLAAMQSAYATRRPTTHEPCLQTGIEVESDSAPAPNRCV